VPELVSLIDILDNPSLYRPTKKGQEQIKSIVGTTVPVSTAAPSAPVSVRNNNPGNLKDVKTGELLKFDTLEAGQKALDDDLKLKLSGQSAAVKERFGKDVNIITPAMLAETWAPATAPGNTPESTGNYAKTIATKLGINPTDPIPNTPQARKLVTEAITEFESGQKIPTAAKPVEAAPVSEPAAAPTIPEVKLAQKTTEAGSTAAAQEIGKDIGKIASEVTRLGQSAGERQTRYGDIVSIVEDKDMQDIFGKLSKSGMTPFVLKQLESGANIGQFGALGIRDLERNLTIAGASKQQIEKFLRVEKHLKQAELEYAKVYLAGQGAVSDNERRLVQEAVGSTRDPAKVLVMQAKIMRERAEFDQKMADALDKYRDQKGTYADPAAFMRKEGKALIAEHNKKLGDILGRDMGDNNPFKVPPTEQESTKTSTPKASVPYKVIK
jgi:hypothetical protein